MLSHSSSLERLCRPCAVTLASDTEAEAVGMLEAILEAASIYRWASSSRWFAKPSALVA